MNRKEMLQLPSILAVLVLIISSASAENIDPSEDSSQYAYGENIGWINFEPNVAAPNVGATVSREKMTGFIWAENIGWINLSPASYGGVTNNDNGQLSGYAWAENAGWINFAPDYGGITIDANGNFNGWAWGENIGWIHFRSSSPVAYKVQVCRPGWEDLANFVNDWLKTGPGWPADLYSDKNVDFKDFCIFAFYWLDYCPDNWPLK